MFVPEEAGVEKCMKKEEPGLQKYAKASDEWMPKVVSDGMEEAVQKADFEWCRNVDRG